MKISKGLMSKYIHYNDQHERDEKKNNKSQIPHNQGLSNMN
jgi:hypothetical protein